ncbi:hypothetical protein [Hyalangium gracile]|uniref:hypothetical protein n=1 Tax=Hyalangium gracile TaxID=394092 RepID=UPI001CCC16CB|nr:hypothetical protein [Hyalangium gracile]
MAFRLQFMPQAVGVLSACQPAVRERVLHELGAIFSGPLLGTESQTPGTEHAGACLLPSGFHVHYAVDWKHGLLHLLELRGPDEGMAASTS